LDVPMSASGVVLAPSDRRARILDAAERCFARNGFHRSTMQDVAAECAMSPGNLYRYFVSKDAIVAGLAERDREMFMADFRALAHAADPMAGFADIGRKHLLEMPRERAALILEIWAESTRNPAVSESCRAMEAAISAVMAELVRRLCPDPSGPPVVPETLTALMMAMGDGLLRRRATDPAFNPAPVFGEMLRIIAMSMALPVLPPSEAVPGTLSRDFVLA
jgi:TetR/AcrR family transcriptional regulator, repressor for uid operon